MHTRETVIEAAKQLFIDKGIENTTISDIANACDKGRRTIYTYFKNKIDIYTAVIECESDRMVSQLRTIAESDAPAADKLRCFLEQRVSPDMNTTSPYSVLKSLFTMDFGRTVKVRKKASQKEEAMLNTIIDQGVSSGQFHPARAELLRNVLYTLIRSLDLMSTNDDVPQPSDTFVKSLSQYIASSIQY